MNEYKALVQKEMGLFTDLEFTTMDYPKIKDKELIIETKAAKRTSPEPPCSES